jgi:hypothetical protein
MTEDSEGSEDSEDCEDCEDYEVAVKRSSPMPSMR